MSVETKMADRQGAQLSQECPPPINNQPMGTNNRTAQCLECGRLFRLGLAVLVVSGTPKSFRARALHLVLFLVHSHQRVAESPLRSALDSTSARQNRRTSLVF
jgi:hypothetical protein